LATPLDSLVKQWRLTKNAATDGCKDANFDTPFESLVKRRQLTENAAADGRQSADFDTRQQTHRAANTGAQNGARHGVDSAGGLRLAASTGKGQQRECSVDLKLCFTALLHRSYAKSHVIINKLMHNQHSLINAIMHYTIIFIEVFLEIFVPLIL
jgi:hypothetical protein